MYACVCKKRIACEVRPNRGNNRWSWEFTNDFDKRVITWSVRGSEGQRGSGSGSNEHTGVAPQGHSDSRALAALLSNVLALGGRF